MKDKKFGKKLSLNKITISTLEEIQLNRVHGGQTESQPINICTENCNVTVECTKTSCAWGCTGSVEFVHTLCIVEAYTTLD